MRVSFDVPCSFHSMFRIAIGEKSTFFTGAFRVLGMRTRKPLRPPCSVYASTMSVESLYFIVRRTIAFEFTSITLDLLVQRYSIYILYIMRVFRNDLPLQERTVFTAL